MIALDTYDMESNPCSKIISYFKQDMRPEMIFQIIVCDYGINKICRVFSLKMNKLQTILDELLFYLDSYHIRNETDDMFYDIAAIVLLMVNNGAKCAGELPYAELIDDYHNDKNYTNNLTKKIIIDYNEYIFICLSVDILRFDYINLLRQTNQIYLNTNLHKLMIIMLSNRNNSDYYNPRYIADKYQHSIGINSIRCNNITLSQALQISLNILNQKNQYVDKRTIALINEIKKID